VFSIMETNIKKIKLWLFVVMRNNWFVWSLIYFSFIDLLIFIVTKLEDLLIWHESNVEISWPSPWARNQGKSLQKCKPKMKPMSHILCSQECRRVWGNEPTHSQVDSHFGTWSPNRLLNLQRMIVGIKTHWSEKFLIPLESS